MSFFQKNKSIVVILLMVGFFIVILLTFVSGVTGSDSTPTPTGSTLSGPQSLVTSTIVAAPGTPRPSSTQISGAPMGTSAPPPGVTVQPATESTSQEIASPPSGENFVATEAFPGTDAPPPPFNSTGTTDDGPPVTDFPPPLTFVPPPTETPPPGNGPPPGS